jgi:hypothetical protein
MWAAQPHNVADGAALTNRELKKEAIARPGAIGDTLVGTLTFGKARQLLKLRPALSVYMVVLKVPLNGTSRHQKHVDSS